MLAAYRALAEQVRNQTGPIPFTYVSIKPSPARAALTEKIRQTNELIRREHLLRPENLYVDVFMPILARDGQPRYYKYR